MCKAIDSVMEGHILLEQSCLLVCTSKFNIIWSDCNMADPQKILTHSLKPLLVTQDVQLCQFTILKGCDTHLRNAHINISTAPKITHDIAIDISRN